MPRRFQQFDVVGAVAVEEAIFQIAALLRRETLGGMDFADAKAGGLHDAARELAVFNLQVSRIDVLDAQIPSRGQHLIGRGRADDRNTVTGSAVRFDQSPGLGIDQFGNRSTKQSLAIGNIVRL